MIEEDNLEPVQGRTFTSNTSKLLKHLDKIKKQGLVPKTKNLIEKHPERIYLFFDEDDAKNYTVIRDLYSEEDSDFVLLKIDSRLLKNIKLSNLLVTYNTPIF